MPFQCTCSICGTVFVRDRARQANARYCSRQCQGIGLRVPLIDRFWQKVTKTSGCWEWAGELTKKGYGWVSVERKPTLAHRVAWNLAGDTAPVGRPIGHTCDNPACVRNDSLGTYEVNGTQYERRGHLWLATPAANSADMVAKGRQPRPTDFSNMRRGETHPYAVVTEAIVRELRGRYTGKIGEQAALAREYGLNTQTVHSILRRENWKHVV